MKTLPHTLSRRAALSLAGGLLIAFTGAYAAIGSKYTADYYLTTPDQFEGKTVTMDVTHLTPSRSKSHIPDIQLFHALTWDKQQYLPGGTIIVAVPKASVEKVVRTYGTNIEAMSRSPGTNRLKGVLRAMGGQRSEEAKPGNSGATPPPAGQMPPGQRKHDMKDGKFDKPPGQGQGQGPGFGPRPGMGGGPGGTPYFVDYEGACKEIIDAWVKNHKGQSMMQFEGEGFDDAPPTPQKPPQKPE